jgi:enoyl-[acyl-carrier-protein] reductase (NADH)
VCPAAKQPREHRLQCLAGEPALVAERHDHHRRLDRVEQILATQAIRQRLDGWDVAQMVLFLASDNARGCTAHSYVVDAGLT